jgi:DNA replication protein DnaC
MNSDELVKQYCKELRLGKNLYENYAKIQASDYADFLAQLLRMEIEHRDVARRNRNLNAAGFDVIKTFEEYSFNHIQIPKAIDIDELKKTSFIDKKENLIL